MDFVSFYQSHRGSVVCVQDGLWVHKGIVHSVTMDHQGFTVWIIDNSSERRGVTCRTLQDFARGGRVWIERAARSWWEAEQIVNRAEQQLGRTYALLTFNCEHFVTTSLGLQSESRQLQTLGLLAGACLCVAVLGTQAASA